jgi:single-strand DNA-binding protein
MNKIQNRVKLIGHLGADPEIRTLESGRKVAIFRVATNSSYTNDKGKLAEISEKHLTKGKKVAVEGKLVTAPMKPKMVKNAISRK